MTTFIGYDPALDYARPDVEKLVWMTTRDVGGITVWALAAQDGPHWNSTVTVQIDVRARRKPVAYERADRVRRLVSKLPWAVWPEGVVVRVVVTEGPFWFPDADGAPRYVLRFDVTVHPVRSTPA